MTEPDRTREGKQRIGVLMHCCDGELEIGTAALRSAIAAFGTKGLFIQIVDDASQANVGDRLTEFCKGQGVETNCHRLDQPLGYRGCITRTLKGLRLIADKQPQIDLVVKIDADTLVIAPSFGDFVSEQCGDSNSLWGVMHTLRRRDLILLLADLLPMGFRRKCIDGKIQRKWELSRLYPVWWTGIGWRALLRGQRIDQIATGGVYLLAGTLLQKLKKRGYLDREINDRYGFVTSEEDTMITLMAKACGGRVVDMNTIQHNVGITRLPLKITAEEILEAGYNVIHPLKNKEQDNLLREQLQHALSQRDDKALVEAPTS